MNRRSWLQPLVLGAVILASVGLGGVIATRAADDDGALAGVGNGTRTGTSGGSISTSQVFAGSIADVVERVRDSAVTIEGSDGVGSGVVVDTDGHVVTNYHVVQGRQTLKVILADGTASMATVLGTDPGSDLAVLKTTFPREKLRPATLGDSNGVRAGDPVFAIGTPFNQPFTVTQGIISAVGRTTQSSFTGRSIRDVLQIDAAVNPGNSGGPLFNGNGEVIGINTSIENPSGRFFIGLGFAIPSNTVKRFLPDMQAGKTIAHPQLGVSVLALDEVIARNLGLGVGRGVYVTSVQPNSAAARAGVIAAASGTPSAPGAGGDVIVSIEGQPVRSFSDLARAIDSVPVGKAVTLVIVRGGQERTLSATLQPWDLQTG